jgi:hypothetical protein
MGAGLTLARTPDSGCTYGIGAARSQAAMVRPTSFVWGPAVGWGCFTVLVLASDGAVYSLCPVAPFGMRLAARVLTELVEASPGGTARAWLQAAFPSAVLPAGGALSSGERLSGVWGAACSWAGGGRGSAGAPRFLGAALAPCAFVGAALAPCAFVGAAPTPSAF